MLSTKLAKLDLQWLTAAARRCNGEGNQNDLINTTQLANLAETVASSRGVVEIPYSILKVLGEVIAGRRICAELYCSSNAPISTDDDDVARSNKTHQHFTEVLENIHASLTAARDTNLAERPAVIVKDMSLGKELQTESQISITNLFAQLEVEEPIPEPLGAQPKAGVLPSAKKAKVSKPLGRSASIGCNAEEEKRFALWCFLEDMRDVRQFVNYLWIEYKEKRVSFLVASNVTYTAFGIMRRSENELAKTYPELSGHQQVLAFLQPANALNTTGILSHDDRGPTFAELLCIQSARTLDSVQKEWDELGKGSGPPETQGPNDTHQPHAGAAPGTALFMSAYSGQNDESDQPTHDTTSENDIGTYFALVLIDLLPDITALVVDRSNEASSRSSEDFLGAICHMCRTAFRPTWLVEACQIYEDIYDTLGDAVEVGLEHYGQGYERILAIEKEFLNSQKGSKREALPPDLLADLKQAVDAGRTLVDWYALTKFSTTDKELSGVAKAAVDVAKVYKALPAEAGGALSFQIMVHHGFAIETLNSRYVVMSMAYLYKAMQHYELIKTWNDMDFFIKLQSQERPMFAELTHTSDGLLRRFIVATGGSFAMMKTGTARNLSRATLERSKHKARMFKSGSKFFREELAQSDADYRLGFSRGEVIDIVLRRLYEERNAVIDARSKHARAPVSPRPSIVIGIQLLKTYKELLVSDETQFNFDYLQFSTTCMSLLTSMQAKAQPFHNTPPNPGDLDYAPAITYSLLSDAASRPRAHRGMKQKQSAISAAATVLQEYIDKQGDLLMTQALIRSSGHLQDALETQGPGGEGNSSAQADATQTAAASQDSAVVAEIPISQCTNLKEHDASAELDKPTKVFKRRPTRKVGGRRLVQRRK